MSIEDFSTVIVRYEIIIRGKAPAKASYFETKEEALEWAFSTEGRAQVKGAALHLISAEVANQEPKFWDIRKDYWNYRASRLNKAA